jgi:predicted DsbA family dithiol-disulfide isomerase
VTDAPLVVPIYFDYASTLCYAAHRVLGRIGPALEAAGLTFAWRPIDLARITGWRRGEDVVGERRAHVLRVARALAGPVHMPPRWIDSRAASAVTLQLAGHPSEPTWRERVWTAIFEEGRDPGEPGELVRWAGDVELTHVLGGPQTAAVTAATDAARGLGVEGVPTFLLGNWPLPGIQDDATMCTLLRRWAERQPGGG